MIIDFWEHKFEELGEFNRVNDRTRYNKEYLHKMDTLQEEYNSKLEDCAKRKGHIVI